MLRLFGVVSRYTENIMDAAKQLPCDEYHWVELPAQGRINIQPCNTPHLMHRDFSCVLNTYLVSYDKPQSQRPSIVIHSILRVIGTVSLVSRR